MIPRPALGIVFVKEIKLAGLEGFQRDGGVLVILEYDAVEVVHALAHRQILCPVIGVAFVVNVFADFVFVDHIRAAGDRLDFRRVLEGFALEPVA